MGMYMRQIILGGRILYLEQEWIDVLTTFIEEVEEHPSVMGPPLLECVENSKTLPQLKHELDKLYVKYERIKRCTQ